MLGQLIKQIITKLHTASLLIDDIEDDSKLRRGVPVAHKIYGVASTINCSNYVYFLALELCQQLESPQATGVFVAELLNLHRGQGRDILWRDSFACPTEEEYRDMVMDKTGGLFRLAVGLMQTFMDTNNSWLCQHPTARRGSWKVAQTAFVGFPSAIDRTG